MVNLVVLYQYQFQSQNRAMRASMLGTVVVVYQVNPVTCENGDNLGTYMYVDEQLVGDGPLSQTRRAAIAELITQALVPIPIDGDLPQSISQG